MIHVVRKMEIFIDLLLLCIIDIFILIPIHRILDFQEIHIRLFLLYVIIKTEKGFYS